jgi:hypothetical protein
MYWYIKYSKWCAVVVRIMCSKWYEVTLSIDISSIVNGVRSPVQQHGALGVEYRAV